MEPVQPLSHRYGTRTAALSTSYALLMRRWCLPTDHQVDSQQLLLLITSTRSPTTTEGGATGADITPGLIRRVNVVRGGTVHGERARLLLPPGASDDREGCWQDARGGREEVVTHWCSGRPCHGIGAELVEQRLFNGQALPFRVTTSPQPMVGCSSLLEIAWRKDLQI